MKKFTVPTREQVAPVNQTIFDNLTKALGFVPNLYATIAYSDNGLSKYLLFKMQRQHEQQRKRSRKSYRK